MVYNIERETNQESLDKPVYRIGLGFVKLGFWFFIAGIVLGFGVVFHYFTGSKYATGNDFLNNISLWWGSPLLYSSGFIQIGGLGMSILGFIYLKTGRLFPSFVVDKADKTALSFATAGLILLFLTGYIGYFIVDGMYPGFYYTPIHSPKKCMACSTSNQHSFIPCWSSNWIF